VAHKYYAVRKGYDAKQGQVILGEIYRSWEEVKPLVIGISEAVHGVNPEYKSFTTEADAIHYLNQKSPYLEKKDNTYPRDGLHCYSDGSFSRTLQNYSYGLAIVEDEQLVHRENGIGKNKEAVSMQQVAGELLGAMRALLYAKEYGHKKVLIFFDYKGVCLHAIGEWARDSVFAVQYYDWMQNFFRENPDIEVLFVKVDAHTGDKWNELADELAKDALGIIK
jgi:ribonuclease HI